MAAEDYHLTWKAPRFTVYFEGEDLQKSQYWDGQVITGKVVLFVRMYKAPLKVNGVWISLKDENSRKDLGTESLGIYIHELTNCQIPMSTKHSHSVPADGYYKLPFQLKIPGNCSSKKYLKVFVDADDFDSRWTKSKTKLCLGSGADPRLFYYPGIIRSASKSEQEIRISSLRNQGCKLL